MKTALVTGASRGIGREIALRLSEKYNVAVNYRQNKSAAEETLALIRDAGGNGSLFKADVSSETEVNKMIEKIIKDLGNIEVAVNNAGIAEQLLFSDITEEKWDRMFDVNIKGMRNVIHAVLPCMIHEKYGRIINISSMWGISGASCEVHYSASKAAVIGLTKALAKELGPSGITVNCVAPGLIDTEMNGLISKEIIDELVAETPVMKIGKPSDVAEAVMFFSSEKSGFITGQTLCVDGGFIL